MISEDGRAGDWHGQAWVFPGPFTEEWARGRAALTAALAELLQVTAERWGAIWPELGLAESARFIIADPTKSALTYPGLDVWTRGLPPVPERGGPIEALMVEHLRQLHTYALGAALASGRAFSADVPVPAGGRLWLRGAGQFLDMGAPDGEIVNVEIVEGTVRVAGRDRTADLRSWPGVAGGIEVNAGDTRLSERICGGEMSVSIRDQEGYVRTLEAALALLGDFDPPLAGELRRSVRAIVPLDRPREEVQTSGTSSFLIGALGIGDHPDPVLVAEVIVHELCHDRLHTIDALAPLFEAEDARVRHFSPWRKEPRTLRGVLKAAHAFVGVAAFFQWLSARPGATDEEIVRHRTEAAIQCFRVEHALGTLSGAARLSRVGQELLNGLYRSLRAMFEAMRSWPRELVAEQQRRVFEQVREGTQWPSRLHRDAPVGEIGSEGHFEVDVRVGAPEVPEASTILRLRAIPASLDERAMEALRREIQARLTAAARAASGHDVTETA